MENSKFASLDSELGKVIKAGSEKLVLTPGLFFETLWRESDFENK